RLFLIESLAEDFVDPALLGVVEVELGKRLGVKQRDARIVATNDRVLLQRAEIIDDQRLEHKMAADENVQQRAAASDPAATCTVILLAVNRQVIAILVRDDLGRHTRVILV